MAYGAPPSAIERRQYDFHFNHLSDAASRALQALRWDYRAESPYKFHVNRPFSFISYGENMTISIFRDSTIDVYSVTKNPQPSYDYGKNQRNINRFLLQLDRELGLVKEEPAEKKRKKHWFRERVLGRKTGKPEDGELIER